MIEFLSRVTWAVLPCSLSTSATLQVFQKHVRAALFSASPAIPDLFAHSCVQELLVQLMSTGLL